MSIDNSSCAAASAARNTGSNRASSEIALLASSEDPLFVDTLVGWRDTLDVIFLLWGAEIVS
jgi:hypothetical protein